MSYEMPQQLSYKEKIMFGLTFRQLAYLFIFAPPILLIFFKTNWYLIVKIFVCINLLALGVGFVFLDLDKHLKNWRLWLKSRKVEKPDKLAKFIPVKEIKDGLIVTSDKRKLAVLKITPVNFSIKPEESKKAISIGFQKLLNSLDFPIQIVMNTENLDLKEYFTELEARIKNTRFQELFKKYKEHLENITLTNKVLNRSFYIIIPEKTDINIQIEICKDKLANLGLRNVRLKDRELNNLIKLFFEAKNGFFPSKIENFPSYIKVDDTFSRIIYAHGYPRSVETGFLDKIVSTPGNFDLSLHIEPYDIETMMIYLNKELQKQRADLYSSQIKNILNPSLEIRYRDTQAVLESLQKGKDKLFNVSLYINCRAKTKEGLDLLTKRIEAELNSLMIIPKQPNFRMLQGLQSCSPLAINKLKQIREVPTEALSAFFPFTSSFLQADKSGVWFGLNRNNIPIIKDIFSLSNPNGLCLASSGSGKSYMAKLLISRHLLNGTKVMIIDPQGEYKALVKQFDGQLIDLSRNSETIINPLDLMGHDYTEKRLALMDLMPIMLGDVSDPQRAILDRALTETYERSMINEDPKTWSNEPPILEDLVYVLESMKKSASTLEKTTIQSLVNRLRMYTDGVFSFLNKKTNINFDNQFVCFDIGNLPKQVKPTMMFLVLDYIYMKMKRDLNRKLLVIDEAWSLLGRTSDASYVFEIVKTCRKFNLALFLINQEVESMLSSEAGKSVLANTSYTLLMRQKPAVIKNIRNTFYLSDIEVNNLLTAGVGEGLLLADDEHSEIKIVASPEEHLLITTKADEILEQNNFFEKTKSNSVKIDKNKLVYLKSDLDKTTISYLLTKGYREAKQKSIFGGKKSFFYLPKRTESSQHMILSFEISEYLKKFTKEVSTYQTVRPDIIFKLRDTEYAIEIETGSTLKRGERIKDKIKNLDEKYRNNWFFVVHNHNFVRRYKKLGRTYEKRNIIRLIDSLARP